METTVLQSVVGTQEDPTRMEVCVHAASDGRWRQRPREMRLEESSGAGTWTSMCNGTLPDDPSPAVEDWQWSAEAVELCGTHHHNLT
jgi:hypothetical protein